MTRSPAHAGGHAGSRAAPHRLRLLTYNILLGGVGRAESLARVIKRSGADIVALQEASDLDVVHAISDRAGLPHIAVGPPSDQGSALNLVVLSRFPLRRWQNHRHPGMLRTHLSCEVEVGAKSLPVVGVHVVHLAARFGERANGEVRRMREMGHVLRDIASEPPLPHVICGDFNALAPGDTAGATAFFGRMAELRAAGVLVRSGDGFEGPVERPETDDPEHDARWHAVGIHPRLDVGISRLPWVVGPLTRWIPPSRSLDRLLNARLRRDTVAHLGAIGYTDCYRSRRADPGYTCATWLLAARIDYVFADPRLAARLTACAVVGSPSHSDPEARDASDHYPLLAEFRL